MRKSVRRFPLKCRSKLLNQIAGMVRHHIQASFPRKREPSNRQSRCGVLGSRLRGNDALLNAIAKYT